MLALLAVMAGIHPVHSDQPSFQQKVFPSVTSTDLNGKRVTIPRDFDSDPTLCIIAFDRRQQKNVQSWIDGVRSIVTQQGISIYEIPTINKYPSFVQSFITSGMRSLIPDSSDRAHFITLFIDKTPFRESLGLTTEKTVYAVLVDHNGNVLWSSSGDYTPEAGTSLQEAVEALGGSTKVDQG